MTNDPPCASRPPDVMRREIYFDHNATTAMDPEVLAAMAQSAAIFGNPSSLHPWGRRAKHLVDEARSAVAAMVGAQPGEVIFTSSGTEALNTALLGVLPPRLDRPFHIVTTAIEHAAVLSTCRRLETLGIEIDYAPVDSSGRVCPEQIRSLIRPHTGLISVMHANNEVGVIQPIQEIASIAHVASIPFLTDAVQTAGKIPLSFSGFNISMMALSAHKFGGPKGIGALICRSGLPLNPLVTGGGQESGVRGGTENVQGIVGMGVAAKLAYGRASSCGPTLKSLRDLLCAGFLEIGDVRVNGELAWVLPGTLNVAFRYIKGDTLAAALALEWIAVSTGSACHAHDESASHVLSALGVPQEFIQGSIRCSLSPSNTPAEVQIVVERTAAIVRRLRTMSPEYRKNSSRVAAHGDVAAQ